tara:strand:- start:197 stop:958 length:762 start_codon:yes stop_codon:yes gene_type:complete
MYDLFKIDFHDENTTYFLCATVFFHMLIHSVFENIFRDHKVYGRPFGDYQFKYWTFFYSIFIQLFVFIPLGFLLFMHYDFDTIKLRSSSVANGYSPYTLTLTYNLIAYFISTLGVCWPHIDMVMHHIIGFSIPFYFLYQDNSLDILLLGIVFLEIGSCTMNLVTLIKGNLKENKVYYERWLDILNIFVFTVGHMCGISCLYEIVFVQKSIKSIYVQYCFSFIGVTLMAFRQKAVVSPFLYKNHQIEEDKGKTD